MVSSRERRGYPRYSAQKIASYHWQGRKLLTLTLDLGLGGMKIKTHRCFPENELLNFKLILDNHSIWVKGRITYSNFPPDKEGASGIEFMELSLKDRSSLERYLATLGERPRPWDMLRACEKDDARMDMTENAEL